MVFPLRPSVNCSTACPAGQSHGVDAEIGSVRDQVVGPGTQSGASGTYDALQVRLVAPPLIPLHAHV